jgi:hypothetical protein
MTRIPSSGRGIYLLSHGQRHILFWFAYRLVTATLRQTELPDESVARIVIILAPTRIGIAAVHCAVPVATPLAPVFVLQVTDATATLSEAVPLKTMDAAEVAIVVAEGELMVKVGGVVSGDLGTIGVTGVTGAACRVIENDCVTCADPSVATMVILFDPIVSGIEPIVHEAEPCAIPLCR